MQYSRKVLVTLAFMPLALGLGGCANKLIGERVGADQVVVAEPGQVTGCKSLGKTTVSVLSAVGPITRSAEAVEDNLVQMARNEAIDRHGDTVVKGNSMKYGERMFEIFKCKP